MKIAVNTPSGNIGRILTGILLDAGADVTLLTRGPEKVKEFEDRGATVHVGDLTDGAFVAKALGSVDTLFWLTPSDYQTDDLRGYQRQLAGHVATAVKANNIRRVMDLSSIGAQHGSRVGPIGGLHDVEKALEDTNAHLIHLRPGYFMENYLMSAETIARDGHVYLPVAGGVVMWMVAVRDIAATAAELLQMDNWERRAVIDLAGPEDLTFDQAATAIGEALGRDVAHVEVTPDEARESMTEMGINDRTIDSFNEMYEGFGVGRVCPESEPRRTSTNISTFTREVLRPIVQSAGS